MAADHLGLSNMLGGAAVPKPGGDRTNADPRLPMARAPHHPRPLTQSQPKREGCPGFRAFHQTVVRQTQRDGDYWIL